MGVAPISIDCFRELAPDGDAAVKELVEVFLEQMREQMANLKDAIDRNAVADVELIAHRCAGTTATCGADAVAQPLLTLERLARDGTLSGAAPVFESASTAFARAEQFLVE